MIYDNMIIYYDSIPFNVGMYIFSPAQIYPTAQSVVVGITSGKSWNNTFCSQSLLSFPVAHLLQRVARSTRFVTFR